MSKRIHLYITALILVGCGGSYYDDGYYYDYAYTDPYVYGYDTSYLYYSYDPYGVTYFSAASQSQALTGTLESAAASIANRVGAYYTPSGCVTATSSGATVTTVFNNCTPPFGTGPITGTVSTTLSQDSNTLIFTTTSSNLTINNRPFTLQMTADATASSAQRTLNINSNSRFTDVEGSRESHGNVTWNQGSGCVAINSEGTTVNGGNTYTSTIENLQWCKDQCPTAGSIQVKGPNATTNSTFDGSSTLVVKSSNGSSKNYDLQCQAAQ